MTEAKDPSDVVDYGHDWTTWLDGDEISTSVWSVSPSGLTIDSEAESTTSTTVWVSAGEHGHVYTLTNTVTTTGGRTAERSTNVPVREL